MKRFTDTEKWRDPWFRKLTPKLKCLWLYVCDAADHSGVVDFDAELATLQIGEPVEDGDVKSFEPRLQKLPNGKWWIVKFIPFQFGQLSRECRPHKCVFDAIDKNGLAYSLNTLSDRVPDTAQDQDQEKDKEQDTKQNGNGAHSNSEEASRPLPPPIESVDWFPEPLRDPDFIQLWKTWEGHCKEAGRPLTGATRRAQLVECQNAGIGRAAVVVAGSISNSAKGKLYWDFDTRKGAAKPKHGGLFTR